MTIGRIFSIGHGGRSRASFLEQLKLSEVSYVVDVRSMPYSRYQPDFSREPLEKFLTESHVRYVFMGDLLGGRPKDEACYTDGKVDYTKTREKDFFIRGVARLKSAHQQGLSICLLCSEGQPCQCHRAKLVGAALADEGVEVLHILPDGSRCTQAEVMAELTSAQGSLFGEHLFSRKAYR